MSWRKLITIFFLQTIRVIVDILRLNHLQKEDYFPRLQYRRVNHLEHPDYALLKGKRKSRLTM